jgi:hypothetical protein
MRRLPAIVSEPDRFRAAHIQADRLAAELRESEMTRALWQDNPPTWAHDVTALGAVISKRRIGA